MLGSEPLFGIIEERDLLTNCHISGATYTLCIPVSPDTKDGPQIRFFPETQGFSIIECGDFSVVPKLEKRFWEEIDKRKLSQSEPARFIMHIGTYAGAHYKPEDFCYEYVLPIENL